MNQAEKQLSRKRSFRRIIHKHLKRVQRMHKAGDLGHYGEVPGVVQHYRQILAM